MERPTGVTILAVLSFIGGVLLLLAGVGLLALGGASGSAPVGAIVGILGGGSILIGLLELVVGYGLWTLQGWAWWWGVVTQGLNVLLGLTHLSQGGTGNGIIGLVISAIILWYFFTPEVKRAFGRA